MYIININFIEILLSRNVINYQVGAFHVCLVQSIQQSFLKKMILFLQIGSYVSEKLQLVQSDIVNNKRLNLA